MKVTLEHSKKYILLQPCIRKTPLLCYSILQMPVGKNFLCHREMQCFIKINDVNEFQWINTFQPMIWHWIIFSLWRNFLIVNCLYQLLTEKFTFHCFVQNTFLILLNLYRLLNTIMILYTKLQIQLQRFYFRVASKHTKKQHLWRDTDPPLLLLLPLQSQNPLLFIRI